MVSSVSSNNNFVEKVGLEIFKLGWELPEVDFLSKIQSIFTLKFR
jgi:hypothetical protein